MTEQIAGAVAIAIGILILIAFKPVAKFGRKMHGQAGIQGGGRLYQGMTIFAGLAFIAFGAVTVMTA